MSDAAQAFRPGWCWTTIDKAKPLRRQGAFENDCMQLGNEDWFLGMILQPSGWQMCLIREKKVISSTTSGQFKLLFGIWSRMWMAKVMLSRLQWERNMRSPFWQPGLPEPTISATMNFGSPDLSNWRETLAKRNEAWYKEREDWAARKERKVEILLPSGRKPVSQLHVPNRFKAYLQNETLTIDVPVTDPKFDFSARPSA